MKRMTQLSFIAAAAALFSGCTTQQIDLATQAVGVANSVRASGTTGDDVKGAVGALGLSAPTSTQVKQVAKLMAANTGNVDANRMLPQIATSVSPVLLSISCHLSITGELPPGVARYVVSGVTGGFTGAKNGMTKHANNKCTDVAGLSNWAVSENKVSFSATYRSAGSGETQTRQYQMQKQTDNRWLFSSGS